MSVQSASIPLPTWECGQVAPYIPQDPEEWPFVNLPPPATATLPFVASFPSGRRNSPSGQEPTAAREHVLSAAQTTPPHA